MKNLNKAVLSMNQREADMVIPVVIVAVVQGNFKIDFFDVEVDAVR